MIPCSSDLRFEKNISCCLSCWESMWNSCVALLLRSYLCTLGLIFLSNGVGNILVYLLISWSVRYVHITSNAFLLDFTEVLVCIVECVCVSMCVFSPKSLYMLDCWLVE